VPNDTIYQVVPINNSEDSIVVTLYDSAGNIIKTSKQSIKDMQIDIPETLQSQAQYNYEKGGMKADQGIDPALFTGSILLLLLGSLTYIVQRNMPLWKKTVKRMDGPQKLISFIALACNFLFFTGHIEFGWAAILFTLVLAGEFKNEIFYPNGVGHETEELPLVQDQPKSVLKYDGLTLNFSDTEIEKALKKRFPYYSAISDENKERFIHRLKKFITNKTFYIHDESGFKEMPILISASAIQLTFGFKKYLLPYFKNIHVFPEEFFRTNDMGICALAGNVSGNTINLSWKHFLHGYQDGSDGQNVGLHELAHALYYQALIITKGVDEDFSESYDQFASHGNKVYDAEMNPNGGLYSEYANKNFQEFWAESAEIFFERPQELKDLYPDLYETLKELFNQDPLNLQDLPLR
jgi:Mlc titration factor MtfA (ptsG expression regulator)